MNAKEKETGLNIQLNVFGDFVFQLANLLAPTAMMRIFVLKATNVMNISIVLLLTAVKVVTSSAKIMSTAIWDTNADIREDLARHAALTSNVPTH